MLLYVSVGCVGDICRCRYRARARVEYSICQFTSIHEQIFQSFLIDTCVLSKLRTNNDLRQKKNKNIKKTASVIRDGATHVPKEIIF